ncbi:MAG: hypothetical protein WCJ95_19945 [Mariniphaga sp.]
MNDLNNNIKFNYLYRDAGNYKESNEIIFSNRYSETIDKIEILISENLIEGEFFLPEQWEIPRLSFSNFSPYLDHDYHEFVSVETTDEEVTESIDLSTFLIRISKNKTR